MTRPLPIEPAALARLAEAHGTPLYVYDAATIRARAAQLGAFDVVRYAQKANSNLAILRLVRELGCAVDAVSPGEIVRALTAGFPAVRIGYTADVFDRAGLDAVAKLDVGVNCGSLDMLPALAAARSPRASATAAPPGTPGAPALEATARPEETGARADTAGAKPDALRARIERKLAEANRASEAAAASDAASRSDPAAPRLPDVTLRVNPGFGHGHDPKVATGGAASKHGIWHADLPRAVELAQRLGLRIVGLHVHVGSGSDLAHLTRSAGVLERWAGALRSTLRSLSAGGGLPVPYRDEDAPFDVRGHYEAWDAARERASAIVGRRLELEVEPGRFLVAESGMLVARVLGTKSSGGQEFVLVDAGFHTLARPAMYGAFHRILPLGAPRGADRPTVVGGPLCESGDVFTRTKTGELDPRPLPPLAPGDLVAIADAGAYGMSMASRYNSQPFPAEVLVDGAEARLVRRRETWDDLLRHERDA